MTSAASRSRRGAGGGEERAGASPLGLKLVVPILADFRQGAVKFQGGAGGCKALDCRREFVAVLVVVGRKDDHSGPWHLFERDGNQGELFRVQVAANAEIPRFVVGMQGRLGFAIQGFI